MRFEFKHFICLFVLLASCTHLKKATEFYNAGQYSQTIELCKAALVADSSDVTAYSLTGQSWFALNQPDSALRYFKTGLMYDSTNALFKEKIAIIYLQSGDDLLTAKKYPQAIEKYNLALQYKTNDNTIREKIGDTWNAAGNFDKALDIYSGIVNSSDSLRIRDKISKITESKNLAQKYIQEGKMFFDNKKYDAAKKQFTKALETDKNAREAKYYLHMTNAMPLYRKGSVSSLWDAISEFGYAAAVFPDKGEPHYFMAMAYNKKDKNEYSNAISEFELAIQVEPDGKYAEESKKLIKEIKARRKKMQDFLSH